jgi:hypothetical protein
MPQSQADGTMPFSPDNSEWAGWLTMAWNATALLA